ncbi:unnamed protein product [marine sediment metagenome]|uniref:Uncharacterized protein n=1 Tax=marine sediment metagenome TaxID=412755 RepID=X1EDA4_9ZZZZ
MSDSINIASFAAGATALDAITDLYCDGAVTNQQQARDILNELLSPARATVERNADGEWEIEIDGTGASVLSLGDNDGYYNNFSCPNSSILPDSLERISAIIPKASSVKISQVESVIQPARTVTVPALSIVIAVAKGITPFSAPVSSLTTNIIEPSLWNCIPAASSAFLYLVTFAASR